MPIRYSQLPAHNPATKLTRGDEPIHPLLPADDRPDCHCKVSERITNCRIHLDSRLDLTRSVCSSRNARGIDHGRPQRFDCREQPEGTIRLPCSARCFGPWPARPVAHGLAQLSHLRMVPRLAVPRSTVACACQCGRGHTSRPMRPLRSLTGRVGDNFTGHRADDIDIIDHVNSPAMRWVTSRA